MISDTSGIGVGTVLGAKSVLAQLGVATGKVETMRIYSINYWFTLLVLSLVVPAAQPSLGEEPPRNVPDAPHPVAIQRVSDALDAALDTISSQPGQQTISAYPSATPPMANDGRAQFVLSQQIGAGDQCVNCGCGGEHRCGTGCPHPWRTGSGYCDDWCVGPHWQVQVDGVILNRENLNVASLENLWGGPNSRIEQFHYEAGARAYLTGYSDTGYGLQLGYVGVDHWQASGQFVVPMVGPREFIHQSGFHSGELNLLPEVDSVWRLLLGVRYVQFNENFFTSDTAIGDQHWSEVKNKMIGFQIGARRDLWEYDDRWFVDVLINGGVYRNRIKRCDQLGTIAAGPTSSTRAEDNETAFLGEVAFTTVYHLNRCLAVRGGYQILFVDGITTADRAMIGPGMDVTSLFYHGAHVGLEYRR